MHKETIKYTDYNGLDRTEEHYFNLTKTELIRMESSVDGGMSKYLQTIIEKNNPSDIINTIEDLIRKSYGVKTADGRGFDKNPKYFEEFEQTPAYDVLFTKLVTDAEAASKFMNGIIPAGMSKTSTNN